MRIELEQSTTIVIDIQERLLPVMEKSQKFIYNTKILLAGLKELGVPIHLTQQYTKGLGQTEQQILDILETTTYIEKIKFSAYDDIKEQIQGKKFIIICGIEAHICVLQTVIDLVEQGFIPVLVADCVSSRKEKDKRVAMKRAEKEGAILTTYESLLFELLQVAGTSTSKAIQKLIK